MTRLRLSSLFAAATMALASAASAEPSHGIAMYGAPDLPADFTSLPYANPDAPKGGRIVYGETGGFDSLNPYIIKGRAPWGVTAHTVETLMGRSWDEPFSLYGLLAETIETGADREWVEFHLRPQARFSDGSPVTVEDVIWSFETLAEKGQPRYQNTWQKIEKVEPVGERGVRFTFNTVDFELPLIVGLRPILKKASWDGRDFEESSLEPFVSSGPYTVGEFEPGRYISFVRNPDYWGNDLPFNAGRHNFDEIRYEFFGDGAAVFEAFKAQETTFLRESNAKKWEEEFNFPAVADGRVAKSVVPHERPSGISGWVMNTRRPVFQDWRVRDAMIHAFNFEFINQTINAGKLPRITSYFSNSELGMLPGPAEGKVAALLEPFADELLPGALEGYSLPVNESGERNRANLARAIELMAEAGWTIQDGVMKNTDGVPFTFEIVTQSASLENEAVLNLFSDSLKRLGIEPSIASIDNTAYKERVSEYDFDMTYYWRGLSLSPGNEQRLYFGKEGVEKPGTRNYMGVSSDAVEAMIDAILTSESREDFVAAVRALDRVMTSGRYVIPIWYVPESKIAHAASLRFPEQLPAYGDWVGFAPDVWWFEE